MRLNLFRAIAKQPICAIVPITADDPGPSLTIEFDDGSCEVDMTPRVPVPSLNFENWNDENCREGFRIVAEQWDEIKKVDEIELIIPILRAIRIDHGKLFDWIATRRFNPPTFWAKQTDRLDEILHAVAIASPLPPTFQHVGSHMDTFEEPFWNLDQVRAWAQTRDPVLVRQAALPSNVNSGAIAFSILHAATQLKLAGRDVDAELWQASGWERPKETYIAPLVIEGLALKLGVPAYLLAFNKNVEVIWPHDAATDALVEAWRECPQEEHAILQSLFEGRHNDQKSILSDSKFERLTPELKNLVQNYVGRTRSQGPPHVVGLGAFEIDKYLLHLFRSGQLSAFGNVAGIPGARNISQEDWGTLEIAVGGDALRLSVWRIGNQTVHGKGEFENVRVRRDDVLSIFPADKPQATKSLKEVLRAAANQRGGTLTHKEAEKIARQARAFTTRDDLRKTMEDLRIKGKQGRKKIRRYAA
jgi:hypothetical protein